MPQFNVGDIVIYVNSNEKGVINQQNQTKSEYVNEWVSVINSQGSFVK